MLDFAGLSAPPLPSSMLVDGAGAMAMLDALGPVDGSRLLLVGGSTLDMMCVAIRRGCTSVVALRACDRPEVGSADLVFVSEAASAACVEGGRSDCLVARIMRAIVPMGGVAVAVDEDAALAERVAGTLRLHGFSAVRVKVVAGGRTLVMAERPLIGRLV